MKKILVLSSIIALFSSAIWLSGCGGNAAQTEGVKNSNVAVSTNSGAVNSNAPATSDAAKAFTVAFKSEPSEIEAGTPAALSLTVKDKQGITVKDLSIVHEKPMHLLLVSKDLAEFYHIHPEEQQADGSYLVSHVFPNGGDYKLRSRRLPN